MSKIALICLPNAPALPSWPWEMRVLPDHLFHAAAVVMAWVEQTDSEYVLFWDMALGQPDPEACLQILEKPGEGWHAGLQLGHAGQPTVLNHLNPTWLLHLDAPAEIASDSWKLSLRAALVRTEIIRKTGVFRADFSNLEAAGLEWGYRMQAAGALLRHEPKLLESTPVQVLPGFSVQDSLSFVALHFPKKWYWWTVFRLLARGTNWSQTGSAVRRTRSKKRLKITPLPRPIEPETLAFKPENWQEKVSVLIPTLNRYPYAINSIEQLKRQTIRPREILSTDQTDPENRWEDFAGQYPEVHVFPQNEKGQCIAWNKLLDESTAPYVLFLGDDADGISPDFLANMCRTMAHYQADMVASHVIEIGGAADPYGERVVKLTDTFPITLIRRELVFRAGKMDMAFNKGIRADQDLAIRCRMLGAHMIFDSSLRILHHRAPVGGLRWHQQRVLTRHISKKSPFKIQYPAESEYYLFRKYFSATQRREYAYILMLSQLFLQGSIFKKLLRAGYFLLNLPKIWARYARLWRNA
jgi:glycosyltransferase involved in cell wall biosynthesis